MIDMGKRGQLSIGPVLGIIITALILMVLLNLGLSLFAGFNTEGNYNTIPTGTRPVYDQVPTVFGFAIVLVIIIVIFGILGVKLRG